MATISERIKIVVLVLCVCLPCVLKAETPRVPVVDDVIEGFKLDATSLVLNDSLADLSEANPLISFTRKYTGENDSVITMTEPQCAMKQLISNDTVFLIGEFHPGLQAVANQPQVLRLSSGSSFQAPFDESGLSRGSFNFNRSGFVTVHPRRSASLITMDGDTLHNCELYCREIDGTIVMPAMNLDSVSEVSLSSAATFDTIQRFSREYSWYIEDMRYPVLELTTHTIYKDSIAMDSVSECSYFPPYSLMAVTSFPSDDAEREAASESRNMNRCVAESPSMGFDDAESVDLVVQIWPTLIENNLHILVNSGDSCEASYKIFYSDGKLIQAASGNDLQLDCTFWHPGTYLLSVKVGSEIKTFKLTKL